MIATVDLWTFSSGFLLRANLHKRLIVKSVTIIYTLFANLPILLILLKNHIQLLMVTLTKNVHLLRQYSVRTI